MWDGRELCFAGHLLSLGNSFGREGRAIFDRCLECVELINGNYLVLEKIFVKFGVGELAFGSLSLALEKPVQHSCFTETTRQIFYQNLLTLP